jgi:phosphoribosyl 1,2-cyclic phosphodiesterase
MWGAMAAEVRFPEPGEFGTGELRYATGDLELVGTSVSALATAFAVDDVKTAVDMGRCSALLAAQQTVLLTHCHSDHVAGLVAWLSAHTRRYEGSPTRVMVPRERRQPLLDALEVWPDLDGVRRRVDLEQALIPAGPGDRVELAHGGWAQSFAVRHSAPSLGWAVAGPGSDRPWFVFAGDGTVEPFQEDPMLLEATAAVVDCSFIDPGTRVAARLGGHGHLTDWIELLPSLPCDTLVLSHLPDEADADQFIARLDGVDAGPVIVPWMAPPRPAG